MTLFYTPSQVVTRKTRDVRISFSFKIRPLYDVFVVVIVVVDPEVIHQDYHIKSGTHPNYYRFGIVEGRVFPHEGKSKLNLQLVKGNMFKSYQLVLSWYKVLVPTTLYSTSG